MDDTVTLTLDEAQRLSHEVLTRNGFSESHAAAITRNVVAVQQDECHSHGLYRLISCVETLRNGGVKPDAVPWVENLAPGVVRTDADQGCSLLAFEQARPILMEKARTNGIALLAVNNAFHFSALWPEVESLSEAGLVALAMTPSHAFVAPAGGSRPLLGTNPVAFSWPRPGRFPYTFDFATSVVARGEIELHRRASETLPAGWAIDAEGAPTTDPEAALEGAMLPFGGHKGAALSIMIELLAGPLIGDLLGHETRAATPGGEGRPQHGELLLAIDPAVLTGASVEQHLAHAEALFEGVLAQGARLPSQRRHAARQRSWTKGLTIPMTLYQELDRLRG
ncbi:Ldh family oxidoreductase [Halomonas halmophila]|uniref:Delta(1)-pyrroline-2-carboxylate/Delta(1)-piperid eine-2-carboxylate reductase n=1 Tax=Halomonas halmophila TaxID=252 RepID=A0A4Y4EYL9_9GAMM|nr:Ldh family oxidoreductase [Halomonas halmophila]GED21425.1 delta(1)-pyrroline-2-carboxylate/Delta(1)-piperid eine-2-carboxylate reductase [Halomonas halmophila]